MSCGLHVFLYLPQQEGHHMCERTCSDVCTVTLEVREIDLNVKRELVQPILLKTKTIFRTKMVKGAVYIFRQKCKILLFSRQF